ncbi:uncharacterized [Tachysurus ichikawai]
MRRRRRNSILKTQTHDEAQASAQTLTPSSETVRENCGFVEENQKQDVDRSIVPLCLCFFSPENFSS